MSKYPNTRKRTEHAREFFWFGAFIEWMETEKHLRVVAYDPDVEDKEMDIDEESIQGLLMEFFEIDPKGLAKEKDALVRLQNRGG